MLVLDDHEFKTSTALYNKDKSILKRLVVPNRDAKEVEEMKKHPIFGKCVIHELLEETLGKLIVSKEQVSCIYADLCGHSFKELELIAKCNLTRNAIVGYTICARSSDKAEFTNSFAPELIERFYKLFNGKSPVNLVENNGKVFVYGKDMRMATIIFKVNT